MCVSPLTRLLCLDPLHEGGEHNRAVGVAEDNRFDAWRRVSVSVCTVSEGE